MSASALNVKNLEAWYGESHILHGIDFQVANGEVVTLLGRNGAGRSTILKAILGLTGKRTGSIEVSGKQTIGMQTYQVAHLGIGYCPEERGIFTSLTAEENLLLPPEVVRGGMTLDTIYEMFPNLYERRASPGGRLSGGEQQMLAMARALMLNPDVLLLDEPSMGLSPRLVEEIFHTIERLKKATITMLLVEQFAAAALDVSDFGYVMENGHIRTSGEASALKNDPAVKAAYLGGGH